MFRATALQKLDSPERLDLAVIVVRPVAWMLPLTSPEMVAVSRSLSAANNRKPRASAPVGLSLASEFCMWQPVIPN